MNGLDEVKEVKGDCGRVSVSKYCVAVSVSEQMLVRVLLVSVRELLVSVDKLFK